MGKRKKKEDIYHQLEKSLKKSCNIFYYLIQKMKKEYWQTYIESNKEEIIDSGKIELEDKNKC